MDNPVPDQYNSSTLALNNFGISRVGVMSYNAPPSLANDVVFFGAADNSGHLFAYNTMDGSPLWSTTTGGTVYGGSSIVHGVLYLGNGYRTFGGSATTGLSAYAPLIARSPHDADENNAHQEEDDND